MEDCSSTSLITEVIIDNNRRRHVSFLLSKQVNNFEFVATDVVAIVLKLQTIPITNCCRLYEIAGFLAKSTRIWPAQYARRSKRWWRTAFKEDYQKVQISC